MCFSPVVARQRLGKNVIVATNTHETIEEMLDASISMQAISSSQNFLFTKFVHPCIFQSCAQAVELPRPHARLRGPHKHFSMGADSKSGLMKVLVCLLVVQNKFNWFYRLRT
jgi:hypothetical protein